MLLSPFTFQQMLKIVIPRNMTTTVKHLKRAGRNIKFASGGRKGFIRETGDRVMLVRSMDIPVKVADGNDIGLCGSDCVEERELELGIKPEVLSEYIYGRKEFNGPQPTLDLIVPEDDEITRTRDIEPGTMILTEHPTLARLYLEQNGLRVAILGREERAPKDPGEFRNWCRENGYVGIEIVHGRIAESVWNGEGYGIGVNESGKTLIENGLRVLDRLRKIEIQLIADHDALRDEEKGPEIESLYRALDRAIPAVNRESEATFRRTIER